MFLSSCLCYFFQISQVSDVVSIGQQLSLMCIGQDNRGNIKLSLKATIKNRSAEGSGELKEGSSQLSTSVGEKTNSQDRLSGGYEPVVTRYEADKIDTSAASASFFIRSVEECVEEEKLAASGQGRTSLNESLRKDSVHASNPSKKRSTSPKKDSVRASKPSKESANLKTDSVCASKPSGIDDSVIKDDNSQGSHLRAKDLKLGTVVTAIVHQIRTHGLVLDLGGGLKGMYRFEVYLC